MREKEDKLGSVDRPTLAFETGLATISQLGEAFERLKILKGPALVELWRAPDDKVGAVEAGEPAGVTLIHAFGMTASVTPGRTRGEEE